MRMLLDYDTNVLLNMVVNLCVTFELTANMLYILFE